MRSAMILVSMLAAGVAGCASSEKAEQKEQEAQYARATPLAFDPTEQYELASWWTNGDQLLNLDASGSYKLYEGTNRFHRPAERGRWWQQSYATLWLEPYEERSRESARIAIRKVRGHLVLDVRDLGAMSELPAPPLVMEDRLTGDWSGAVGELGLGGDLRYRFKRHSTRPSVPAQLGSEDGGWRVEANLLILQPDSARLAPTLMRIIERDATIHLETSDGRLARIPSPLEQG